MSPNKLRIRNLLLVGVPEGLGKPWMLVSVGTSVAPGLVVTALKSAASPVAMPAAQNVLAADARLGS